MWAFARLQIPDERFFDLLGDMCVRKMELFNAQRTSSSGCVEINQWSGALMPESSGVRPTPPRHRAGVASMAWRS